MVVVVVAACVFFTAAAAASCNNEENTKEDEAVCNEKIIIEISDTQKSGAREEANNATQHQQCAENT
jgi:hypothetical protein